MARTLHEGVNRLMPVRQCTRCGETKPTTRDNFGTKPNGLPKPWCRACAREATNSYAANNREAGRARARRRKERLESVGVVNEHLIYRESLLIEQGYKCYFCDVAIDEETSEIDHLTPILRGGDNDPSNLAACCMACNRAKKDRTAEEFFVMMKVRYRHYAR